MSLLDIRTEAVRIKAEKIESLRQSDMEILGKIRALIFNLEEVWKGDAAEAYVNKYLSQQNSLTEFYNTLHEVATLLNDASFRANSIDAELLNLVMKVEI